MLDSQLLRKDLSQVISRLARRGFVFDQSTYNTLESERKQLQIKTESLQADRNKLSKEVGRIKGSEGDASAIVADVSKLAEELKSTNSELILVQSKLESFFLNLPNLPMDDVPLGSDEGGNQELRKWGIVSEMGFSPKDHVDIGNSSGELDLEAATRLSGARFSVLKGRIAKLHRVLGQFMIDVHTEEHDYVEIQVPLLVSEETMTGTGQLPKFKEDLFRVGDQNFYLIPTAEVPVTNIGRKTVFEEKDLPVKFACLSSCFRSEAGSYGKDTRGLIRQHQFEKVELVQFVHATKSIQALNELTNHAETILRRLELPYRVVELCTGDLGFSAAKTFDLEVWMPGQKCYREISSCSNFVDFQARRIGARVKNSLDGKNALLHTINGSGLAVGRTLIAVLENYQQEDGRIKIPKALKDYFSGDTYL
ncbi:MAG: serine--tRNA ligase [Gammaproteobacteria bacterium]